MTTVAATATQYIDSVIQKLSGNETLEKLVEKLTAKDNRSTILGSAAVMLTAYYVLIHQMELNRPKGFRSIPKLNNTKNVISLFKNDPFVDRYNANLKEPLEDQGIGRVRVAGNDIIFLATPEYSRIILNNNDMFLKDTIETSPQYTLARKFFGGINLVFSNGDVWKRHRAVANPAFHRSWDTKLFGHCATEMSEQMDKDMASEGTVEIHSMFQRLTLDALGLAAFGFDFQSLRNPNGRYVSVYNDLMKGSLNGLYFLFPYLDRFPIGQRYKMHQKVKEFDGLLYDIIKTKKAEIESQKVTGNSDLLTMMIKAAENEGATAKLTDQELRDNMSIFFLAGHDTTANSLACTLYYLALHPEYQERAREEALNAIGDDGTVPTSDQIKHLPFIDNCIKESLRLCPSVAQLPARVLADEFHLSNGYILPKGSRVILSIYSMHHNKKYWGADVEEFRPDRFDESANGGKKIDPYLWVPFSFGSRSCIGQQFSMIEQRVVLTMLLQRHFFKLPADSPHRETLQFGRGGLLHPANLRLEVTDRA